MTTKFTDKLKGKTDSELMEYIENSGSYQKEAILTAIMELESRGHSNDEMQTLKNDIQSKLLVEKNLQDQAQESKIPKDLPDSISKASKMIYFSVALGVINPIIVNLLTEVDNFANPKSLIIILISTITLAFVGYQINLGKRWARDIFTVLVGLGFLLFPVVIADTFRLSPIVGVLTVAQAFLQGYAIFLLFKKDSKYWYRNQNLKKNTAHNKT